MSRTSNKSAFLPFQPQNRLAFSYLHLLSHYLPFQTLCIPTRGIWAGAAVDVEFRDGGWRRAAGGERDRRECLKRKCCEKTTYGRGEWEPRTGGGHDTLPTD